MAWACWSGKSVNANGPGKASRCAKWSTKSARAAGCPCKMIFTSICCRAAGDSNLQDSKPGGHQTRSTKNSTIYRKTYNDITINYVVMPPIMLILGSQKGGYDKVSI